MNIAKLKDFRGVSRQRSEEGFTLIELMIVVVIIGILAAIAIPVFANQQKSADFAAAQSDVKSVQLAAFEFKAKNDGKLPETCDDWKSVYSQERISPSTSTLRVRVSPDGYNLYIEGHSRSIESMPSASPAELEARGSYIVVYDSKRSDSLTTRSAYANKYGVGHGGQAGSSGFTKTGFNLPALNSCWAW